MNGLSTAQKTYLLSGGIGDILLSIPFLLSPEGVASKILVLSHQLSARDLLLGMGIKIEKFLHFSDSDGQKKAESELSVYGQIFPCPRTKYMERNPFPVPSNYFGDERKVLGLHLGGSSYSIGIQKKLRLPTKNLPEKIIRELIKLDINILIFGEKNELEKVEIPNATNLKVFMSDDICESMSHVALCDIFLGSDSSFKTFSSMLKIPTMVWLGDYIDEFRDSTFINPYIIDGHMEVFRYSNLENQKEFNLGIKKSISFIENVLFPPDTKLWTTIFNSDCGPMVLNLRDKGVSGDIMLAGYFEANQVNLLVSLTNFLLTRQRNIIVYDVGANLGTHTLAIAKASPSRVQVRAFEVQSKVFYMLCGTVAINGLGNVHCHHLAVGGHNDKTIEINIPSYSANHNFGGFEVKEIAKSDNQNMQKPNKERVRMATLDSFDEMVDLIKIDVEGMEEDVLAGAGKIFERSSPICFVEIFKSNPEKIISFFKGLGYLGYSTHQDLLAIPPNLNLQINGLNKIF